MTKPGDWTKPMPEKHVVLEYGRKFSKVTKISHCIKAMLLSRDIMRSFLWLDVGKHSQWHSVCTYYMATQKATAFSWINSSTTPNSPAPTYTSHSHKLNKYLRTTPCRSDVQIPT